MKAKTYITGILSVFFIQCTVWSVLAQDGPLKEAEVAYTQGDYNKAIELYEETLESNGASAEIYYNLGNAYYRANRIAPAILNYERALLLDPGDGDIRFNLQMAREKTVDKIEPVGEFFLVKWIYSLQNKGSVDSWAMLGIVTFLLLIFCLLLFFFSRWVRMKKVGFYLGIVCLLAVIVANVFAKNQKNEIVNHTHAIVFSPTVTVKSSPDVSGTDLFILHEGTKVFIKSSLGNWKEIELEDGNVGWLPGKDIEII
ncbi:MAG: tetratricopeptide repeat protein [Tannerellaceae bacterium]|jgi:hypothetical protein|nr:tetratricopeptide repeat protein [Tannerellaceae bacterium]